MRKIILDQTIDPNTFEFDLKLKMKDSNGNVVLLGKFNDDTPEEHKILSKVDPLYTPNQIEKIKLCNKLLEIAGDSPLSNDEIVWMLDPIQDTQELIKKNSRRASSISWF